MTSGNTPQPPPEPTAAARAWDVLRACWQFSLGWLFCALFVPLMVLAAALAGGDRDRVATPMIRLWGRVLLAICRVQLRGDLEAVRAGGRRVLVINHTSTLDVLLACALWPERGSGVLKKEFRDLPILGIASEWLGQISVDRSSRDKAVASLAAAAARMKREDRAVIMSPEGTRSRTGELGRFKLGAWHLAAQADAPIVPIVLHGVFALWPRSQLSCAAGVVTIEVLDPITVAELPVDDYRGSASALRDLYVEALARGPKSA